MKLTMELVPKTAWRENLRTRMGRTKWNKLRTEVLGSQNHRCAKCGSDRKLQCHEIWEYDDASHIQRLKGFEAVCSLCHLAEHFGLAQNLTDQGHANLDEIIDHFITVSDISQQQFDSHKTDAFALWRTRSEIEWELDLGDWASLIE